MSLPLRLLSAATKAKATTSNKKSCLLSSPLLRTSSSSTSFTSTTTTTTAASSASTTTDCARVLVVGSGRMGQIRARLVQANPKFELVGIVDPIYENAQLLANTQKTRAFPSLMEAFEFDQDGNNDAIDGLIVSSPTTTHESIIREAIISTTNPSSKNRLLSAIFMEKPIAETSGKIAQLFELSENNNIDLCCGFQRRFDPSYVAAMESVRNNDIGTIQYAHLFFADHPVPPRSFLLNGGGNIFLDLLAHDVDYILHTIQDQHVISVYAIGTSSDDELAAHNVHDQGTVVLQFSKGATATLFLSRSAVYGYDQRCELFGSHGLLQVQNIPQHSAVLSNQTGIHAARWQHSFPERFNDAFALELDAFANVILHPDDYEWPVTGAQCMDVQCVADAARLSADTGQVVPVVLSNNNEVSPHNTVQAE